MISQDSLDPRFLVAEMKGGKEDQALDEGEEIWVSFWLTFVDDEGPQG